MKKFIIILIIISFFNIFSQPIIIHYSKTTLFNENTIFQETPKNKVFENSETDTLKSSKGNFDNYSAGYLKGQKDAEKMSSESKYKYLGFFGGCLFGMIGCLGVGLLAKSEDVEITHKGMIKKYNNNYFMGYKKGYTEKMQDKNFKTAITAGAIGYGVQILAIMAYYVFYVVFLILIIFDSG